MSETNKILLIDDHSLFADGLSLVLKTLGEGIQVSVSNDADSVLTDVNHLAEFDLVLIDLNMPVTSGFSFLEVVRSKKLPIRVGVISAAESKTDIERAFQLGACGFITKDTSSADMVVAVQHLLDGHQYLSKQWQGKIDLNPLPTATDDGVISGQQKQLLNLMRDGMQNRQIATALGISLADVREQVETIFNTLGVNNRTNCVQAALQLDLI